MTQEQLSVYQVAEFTHVVQIADASQFVRFLNSRQSPLLWTAACKHQANMSVDFVNAAPQRWLHSRTENACAALQVAAFDVAPKLIAVE